MERKYEKDGFKPRWRYESSLRPGLKKVNIGEDVWLIGRDSIVEGRKHQVIYGPGRKEYHLWDHDVDFVNLTIQRNDYGPDTLEKGRSNRQGNYAIEYRVKVYILTSILDERKNWCFNLNYKPEVGKRVKVIYSNGTVKWVDEFDGEFRDAELISKRHHHDFTVSSHYKTKEQRIHTSITLVEPLGYRKW